MNNKRTVDVQTFIDSQRFSPFQWTILVLCFLVVAADGMDTAAVGFIAPSLVQELGVARAALGPVMSAALVGLGIGALGAGPLADRVGRRTVLVLSVFFFGLWSLAAAHAPSIESLTLMRFMTGLGLGAAMPNAVTLMSEYAPARIRAVVVNAMFSGFSCGVAIGAVSSAWLIPHFGWQSVLVAGGVGPIALTFVLVMLLPESAQFMVTREHGHARIARVLSRIAGDARFDECRFVAIDATVENRGSALRVVLSSRYRFGTLMLWLAYFMGLLIYYLLTNWLPTLFRDAGFSGQNAALMTSLFPIGGVAGNLGVGWLMDRFKANRVIACTYVVSAVLVMLVGHGIGHQLWLGTLIFLTGTVATSAVTSMSALAANFYPTEGRATGVAWMIGMGRIGGVTGALVGAALMGLGWQFGSVFSLLAVPAMIAACGVYATARRVRTSNIEDAKLTPAVE
ncbi:MULTISPECIES: aromatic acid/H+ symport family MFS transporter [Paraburkholderia]|uniref:Aromatic acid/H+ symport family MFS transporter n=1 Tax=Paraburkholderia madseniana TaxID=2599607 RepID=A0AAP5BBF1_9BURK|nr:MULTISPECIES: aromatic acid/H+ symport family MFS transporter [Paraburkholderia]MCX4145047.1 aromatic acid/H+ symport family MFS transporter [Paraburkholderia madseniana]MDN7147999.1 aromatic acid/H+ symport family MFS transporter [Paraburkholderia sp. WS6]MDQ6406879.1 aromatic acid/H+ symport family MFS transporter [Paraburkholderia madseniana]